VYQGFEALALKRLQRLHYLEAQVKQYRYSINRPGGADGMLLLPGMSLIPEAGSEGALIDELATGDFGKKHPFLLHHYLCRVDSQILHRSR
jgi:hypothetical protein